MPRVQKPQPVPPRAAPGFALREGWLWLATFAAVVAAYMPVFSAGFIWDDSGHVTRADLRSLGGLIRIWFEPGATQQYYPLLHSAFWLEHRLWGDAAWGYHAVNVLLHALNACLFAHVLRKLAVPGAWFAALLFALHPVCVESVAWISEQKNTLSLALYLAAALAYLRHSEQRTAGRYALASVLFVGALATKTVTATLPAALLVVLAWRRRRWPDRRDVRALAPWFGLALVAGLHTAWFERELIGAQGDDFSLGWLERALLAGRVVWFYLGKLAWPAELIFIYPRWEISAAQAWQYLPLLAAVVVLAALVALRGRAPGVLAAGLIFGGTLFPVLGFFDVYPFRFSFVADHFQYHACLAVLALAAAGATQAARRFAASMRIAAVALVLLTLGSLTWRQGRHYGDEESLYRTTLAKNPTCWMAHNNLAIVLAESGRVTDAVSHLQRAIELRPDFAQAHNNLGDDLIRLNRPREAVPALQRALELQPGYPEAHYNLGVAFMSLARGADGIAQFEAALQARPGYALAERGLGRAYAASGRMPEAVACFRRAVELTPTDAEAHIDLGYVLLMQGRPGEALPSFRRAVELAPGLADAHFVLGRAWMDLGRLREAAASFEETLALDPEHSGAREQLAVLRQRGGP